LWTGSAAPFATLGAPQNETKKNKKRENGSYK
jgi:hypothetical protein